jgi:hypothetical protein
LTKDGYRLSEKRRPLSSRGLYITQTSSTSAPEQGPPKLPQKVIEGMVC